MCGCKKYLFYKNIHTRRFLHTILVSGAIIVSSTLRAGSLPEVEITEQSGVYQIKLVALIAAPASYERSVLTDYKHIYRLNPSIIESEVLE